MIASTIDFITKLPVIRGVYETLFGEEDIPSVKPAKVKDPAKKIAYDTTKLTVFMCDYIKWAHLEWQEHNKSYPNKRLNMNDLTARINAKMGTHKSVTTLRKVWVGAMDLSKCEQGEAYFTY